MGCLYIEQSDKGQAMSSQASGGLENKWYLGIFTALTKKKMYYL